MATDYPALDKKLRAFIERQHIFFTATAAAGTRINISPRPTDCFRVIGDNAAIYLDKTGSGMETAAHTLHDGRITMMFCAFDKPPMILRLYGEGRAIPRGSDEYAALLAEHFGGTRVHRRPPDRPHRLRPREDLMRLWRSLLRVSGRARHTRPLGRDQGA